MSLLYIGPLCKNKIREISRILFFGYYQLSGVGFPVTFVWV